MAIYGFIGTGNMGSAMARAARRALSGQEVLLANRTPAKAEALARELDCRVGSNADVALEADYIFLGVKPQMMAEMLAGIAPVLAQRKSRFILVSLAAGLTMSRLQELAGGNYPVMRILPNTPAAIGAGMVFYTMGPDISDAEAHDFLDTMSGAGRFAPLPEHLIDAGSSVAGCGPAFAAMFLEALADGGVACVPGGRPNLRSPDDAGNGTAGSDVQPAHRCAERCRLFSRWIYHSGRAGSGGSRLPRCRDGRGHCRLGKERRSGQIIPAGRKKLSGPFFTLFHLQNTKPGRKPSFRPGFQFF